MNTNNNTLLTVNKLTKSFRNNDGKEITVVQDISFSVSKGEIVCILGKSGSGKSTLLRMIAGLTPPTRGDIKFHHHKKNNGNGLAMVFQSFALMPWLTVLENVELGLEAKGVSPQERRQRALKAIDTIGLDGFESAYPKELSGGMRQRVGFARALVVEQDLLLMDEPFSSLDILTAENLRSDLIELWVKKQTEIKGIICVTHEIEEALEMADKILLFGSNPGHIQHVIDVRLPYPRNYQSPEFKRLLNKIYTLMTVSETQNAMRRQRMRHLSPIEEPVFAYNLPNVNISEITGLIEIMEEQERSDRINIQILAESFHLDVNDILQLIEALDMLKFTEISRGDIALTEAGKEFANADILHKKTIFAKHLLKYIPLAKYIRNVLDKEPTHRTQEHVLLEELEKYFSSEESERILKVIIDWGRYAEIFAYDYDSGLLSLENPQ